MQRFILFLLVFPVIKLSSQTNTVKAGYTRCTWAAIQLMNQDYVSTDSSITVVTTRGLSTAGDKAFLTNRIATDSSLHFYTVYFSGNNWRAVPHSSLELSLRTNPDAGDYVVYTEGDGKTFPDNIDRGTRMSRLYQVHVILFDWPSRVPGYNGIRNIHQTARNAYSLARQYHRFLMQLVAFKTSDPEKLTRISLFFHSMGNAVFCHSMLTSENAFLEKGLIHALILNAACFPVKHHAVVLEGLHFQDHIYVIFNRKDKTLRAASWLFHTRMLGCQLHTPLAGNACYIDIHPQAGNKHNYFIDQTLLSAFPPVRVLFNDLFHAVPENQLLIGNDRGLGLKLKQP
ncbi:MAG TPA: alpha/beta hydrolase [Bacteroidia bacterium]|jgi:hypothetical protein|nr:alpha/beta hydrolase [Bacteroidia bacterium]